MSAGAALKLDGLSKRFGGALALDNVSLEVARGEVHGLLGSNGSGKSTLIKVLSGFHTPEPGASLSLYGSPVRLPVRGKDAHALGLAFVHQNLGLLPSLSVAENLNLTRLATEDDWRLSWSAINRDARAVFARYDLALDPETPVARLSAVEQALLAIVRAAEDLAAAEREHKSRPGVLVLDEPTPFLPRAGVDQLFSLIRRVTQTGASVIFVSHDIDEVRTITDRATVLRDGRLAGTVTTAGTPHAEFVELIIGKALAAHTRAAPPSTGRPLARVDALAAPGLGPLTFEIAPGEILGLAGLIGSGFDQVPARLYGARPGTTGTLTLTGERLDLTRLSPKAALAEGIAYLPADRLGEAGAGSLSVADNIALPVYERLKNWFGLTTRAVEAHAHTHATAASVKPAAPHLPLASLSGGNQQKALMAKWLQVEPRLTLLDEPTQGVDVGARQDIWRALEAAAERGAAVLVASTDYEQLAEICHRVLIFSGGTIGAELSGQGISKEAIAQACFTVQRRAA